MSSESLSSPQSPALSPHSPQPSPLTVQALSPHSPQPSPLTVPSPLPSQSPALSPHSPHPSSQSPALSPHSPSPLPSQSKPSPLIVPSPLPSPLPSQSLALSPHSPPLTTPSPTRTVEGHAKGGVHFWWVTLSTYFCDTFCFSLADVLSGIISTSLSSHTSLSPNLIASSTLIRYCLGNPSPAYW